MSTENEVATLKETPVMPQVREGLLESTISRSVWRNALGGVLEVGVALRPPWRWSEVTPRW
jgi:hypothetical protein